MPTTAIDRRRLLLAGLAAALPWPARAGSASAPLLAFCTRPEGRAPELLVFDRGTVVLRHLLPTRAHGLAWDPVRRQGIVFARRPGTWALAFSPDGGAAPRWLEVLTGRHFYGHGCFSPDGALLYTTENDYEAARGCIGIYDAADDFRRLGEFDSGGVGPHDLCLLPGGRTLLVANGGIETHPDYGRAKLNLADMRSSLSLIDAADGSLLVDFPGPPDWQQLSLRHVSLDGQGRPWFAGQYEGLRYQPVPLIGRVTGEGGLTFAAEPQPGWRDLEGYAASVACWGDLVAATLPRADRLLLWRAADGTFQRSLRLREVFALAPRPGQLFVGGMAGGGYLDEEDAPVTLEPVENHALWLV